MPEYFLGVDGGGTKTHIVIADATGSIKGVAVNGGSNWESIGLAEATKRLKDVVDRALHQAGISYADITQAVFALAGADWPSDEWMLQNSLATFFPRDRIVVCNDALSALFAGSISGYGCISIAGTGGKTIGRDAKNLFHTMGMVLGEAGGSTQLVDVYLNYLAEVKHGKRAESPSYKEFMKQLGYSSGDEFFEAIARKGLVLDSEMARDIVAFAETGDAISISSLTYVATMHAEDAIAMINKLDLPDPRIIYAAGGLHTSKSQSFTRTFKERIEESGISVRIEILSQPPVIGAVSYAHQLVRGVDPSFFSTLSTSALIRSKDFGDASGF